MVVPSVATAITCSPSSGRRCVGRSRRWSRILPTWGFWRARRRRSSPAGETLRRGPKPAAGITNQDRRLCSSSIEWLWLTFNQSVKESVSLATQLNSTMTSECRHVFQEFGVKHFHQVVTTGLIHFHWFVCVHVYICVAVVGVVLFNIGPRI